MVMEALSSVIDSVTSVLENRAVMTAIGVGFGIFALNMLGDDTFKIGGNAQLFLDKED